MRFEHDVGDCRNGEWTYGETMELAKVPKRKASMVWYGERLDGAVIAVRVGRTCWGIMHTPFITVVALVSSQTASSEEKLSVLSRDA